MLIHLFFTSLFVSERKQIAFMADEKSPMRISHRLFATSRSETRISMDNYIDLLAELPLFSNINKADIQDVLKQLNAYTKNFSKNEYVRVSGDPVDFIGIVLSGEIQILKDDYYGNRSITASFSKGSMFAEAFVCSKIKTLPIDIMSSTDSTIMFLDSNILLNSYTSEYKFHNTLVRNLLYIVSNKNILLTQKLSYHSHKTTSEKIMAYLTDQAKARHSSEFTIPFNRQQLADYLGVERSAMSYEISKLQKQGHIETNRSYFKLL